MSKTARPPETWAPRTSPSYAGLLGFPVSPGGRPGCPVSLGDGDFGGFEDSDPGGEEERDGEGSGCSVEGDPGLAVEDPSDRGSVRGGSYSVPARTV